MNTSSPSRKTSARNPSHFGSKIQPSPSGSSLTRLASIGKTGGFTGRSMRASYATAERMRPYGAAGLNAQFGGITIVTSAAGSGDVASTLTRASATIVDGSDLETLRQTEGPLH